MTAGNIKQTYKNRAEAYQLLLSGHVSQSKFFTDAKRLDMVKPDKTIELSTLLAYMREELKVDPTTGRSLVDRDLDRQMDELELKEKKLKIEKLERESRKDDKNWVHRDTVNEREGALVGQILNEGKYQLGRAIPALITICKGDPNLAPEFKRDLTEAFYNVFRTLYDSGEIDLAFEEEEE